MLLEFRKLARIADFTIYILRMTTMRRMPVTIVRCKGDIGAGICVSKTISMQGMRHKATPRRRPSRGMIVPFGTVTVAANCLVRPKNPQPCALKRPCGALAVRRAN